MLVFLLPALLPRAAVLMAGRPAAATPSILLLPGVDGRPLRHPHHRRKPPWRAFGGLLGLHGERASEHRQDSEKRVPSAVAGSSRSGRSRSLPRQPDTLIPKYMAYRGSLSCRWRPRSHTLFGPRKRLHRSSVSSCS